MREGEAQLGVSFEIARPRRVVCSARLIDRRARAFWRTYGPRAFGGISGPPGLPRRVVPEADRERLR